MWFLMLHYLIIAFFMRRNSSSFVCSCDMFMSVLFKTGLSTLSLTGVCALINCLGSV